MGHLPSPSHVHSRLLDDPKRPVNRVLLHPMDCAAVNDTFARLLPADTCPARTGVDDIELPAFICDRRVEEGS